MQKLLIIFSEIHSFPIEFIYPDYKVQTVRTTTGRWIDILIGNPKELDVLQSFTIGNFCGEQYPMKESQH